MPKEVYLVILRKQNKHMPFLFIRHSLREKRCLNELPQYIGLALWERRRYLKLNDVWTQLLYFHSTKTNISYAKLKVLLVFEEISSILKAKKDADKLKLIYHCASLQINKSIHRANKLLLYHSVWGNLYLNCFKPLCTTQYIIQKLLLMWKEETKDR